MSEAVTYTGIVLIQMPGPGLSLPLHKVRSNRRDSPGRALCFQRIRVHYQ